MNLTELVNRLDDFEFEYDGYQLKGRYYKYKISPQYLATLKKMEEEGTEPDEIGWKIISDSIESWDMDLGDGKPFPPTVENLKQVPVVYLIAFGKYLGELRDGNPTQTNSQSS